MKNHPGTTALFALLLFVGAYAAGYYGRGVLSAPSSAPAVPSAVVLFVCPAERSIAAQFTDRSVSIALSDGRTMVLPQTVSGSGARYASADESIVFWNKGSTAFVQEEGDMITYDNCVDARDESEAALSSAATVRALQVLEDSRCPANANCIWAGTVRVRAEVSSGDTKEVVELALGEPRQVLGKTVMLSSVLPQKVEGQHLALKDYTFSFAVK